MNTNRPLLQAGSNINAANTSLKLSDEDLKKIQQRSGELTLASNILDEKMKNTLASWLRSFIQRFDQYSALKQNFRFMSQILGLSLKPNGTFTEDEQLDNMDISNFANAYQNEAVLKKLNAAERNQVKERLKQLDQAWQLIGDMSNIKDKNKINNLLKNNVAAALAYLCALDHRSGKLESALNRLNSDTLSKLQEEISLHAGETNPLLRAKLDLVMGELMKKEFNHSFGDSANAQTTTSLNIDEFVQGQPTIEEEKEDHSIERTITKQQSPGSRSRLSSISSPSSALSVSAHSSTPSNDSDNSDQDEVKSLPDSNTAARSNHSRPAPQNQNLAKPSPMDAYLVKRLKRSGIYSSATSALVLTVAAIGIANSWNPIGWGILLGVGILAFAVAATSFYQAYQLNVSQKRLAPLESSYYSFPSSTAVMGRSRLAHDGLVLDNGQRVEEDATPTVVVEPVVANPVAQAPDLRKENNHRHSPSR